MGHFRKNVFRMARQNKGSFIGAVLIIAIGIFIFVAMMDTLSNLRSQISAYYESGAIADIFAEVGGISEAELQRLGDIPGIDRMSGKMSEDVRLLASNQEDIVTVRLLSYDADDALNKLSLSSSFSKKEDLFLGSGMTGAYGYGPGEALKLLWKGKSVDFTLAGTCHSPDYIYSIPPGGAMIPDGKVYDIACIQKQRMEELVGRSDSLNELGFTLKPGYSYEDVRYQLSAQLQPYGLKSLTSRADQTSYHMVQGEMGKLVSMGAALPAMFMAVSVFMMYVVLKKMIDKDRSLIGTMKAFGMTDRELMGAYLLEGIAVGLAGALAGCAAAKPLAQFIFRLYAVTFSLPDAVYHDYFYSRAAGFAIALGTGITAVFLGVRTILSITPAQAMRSSAPDNPRNLPLPERLSQHLGALEKMSCRSIARNPFRGFLIVLAVAFPFSLASVFLSYDQVAEQMYVDQFDKIQVYDLQLSLDSYTSPIRAAEGGDLLNGVQASEAVCAIAARLHNDNRSEFAMLYGLKAGSEMWKIMDIYGTFYEPPDRGLILNSRIAEKLHIKKGDMVNVAVTGMTVEGCWLPVREVIAEGLGNGCYISLDSMEKVFRTEPAANTVLLKTEEGQREQVSGKLLDTSRVTYLVDAGKIIASYRSMTSSIVAMLNLFAYLALGAGGILIYNISMINIRERVTEFGTLMILGESDKEIRRLVLFEQTIYFLCGILAGIPGSQGFKGLLVRMISSDSYTIDMAVQPGAYLMAFGVCFGITLLACRAELGFIRKIQLTDILKERE